MPKTDLGALICSLNSYPLLVFRMICSLASIAMAPTGANVGEVAGGQARSLNRRHHGSLGLQYLTKRRTGAGCRLLARGIMAR